MSEVVEVVCENCEYYDHPPRNQWPDCAFGCCTNPKNIVIGPSGWGSGDSCPVVSDTMSCSNFEVKI